MHDEHQATDRKLGELRGQGPRLTTRAMPRRLVLRAAGLAVALPMFEAMVPRVQAATWQGDSPAALKPDPRRLVYVYVPNGVKLDDWRQSLPETNDGGKPRRHRGPKLVAGDHALTDVPALLRPLEAFRRETLLLRGLTADKARANGDGPGDHARAAAAFLTGVQPLKTEGRVQLGISADQLAAQQVGGVTRIRSLTLGLERGLQSGQCDSGYACAYSGHISWESADVPAAKEVSPRAAFDRLFRGGNGDIPAADRQRLRLERRSVLDFVRAEAKELSGRLGAADRARLDEYETGLRELERQLAFDGAAHEGGIAEEDRPGRGVGTFAESARLMGEVLALAFETDVTRVATLMYGNEGSGRRYEEVGVSEGHHTLSHHGGDVGKLESIGRINQLHMGAFKAFVERLATKRVPSGSLLDSTMLVYGSGIAEGNRHDHHDLPIVMVAGERTGVRGGRTLVVPRETPLNNLHAALVARMGLTSGLMFGDATGVLEELA